MKVRMKARISGSLFIAGKPAQDWPEVGGEIDLPDTEAARLCDVGYAEPVAEQRAEKRPARKAEKRA